MVSVYLWNNFQGPVYKVGRYIQWFYFRVKRIIIVYEVYFMRVCYNIDTFLGEKRMNGSFYKNSEGPKAMLQCSFPHNIDLVYVDSPDFMVAPTFKKMNNPTRMASVNYTSFH